MLFSRVKISCLRAKAHLAFHWCLYKINGFNKLWMQIINTETQRDHYFVDVTLHDKQAIGPAL